MWAVRILFLRTVGALIQSRKQNMQDEWKRSDSLLAPAAVYWSAQSKGMEKCFILCTVGTVSSLVSFRGCRLELQKEGATLSFGEMLNFSSLGRKNLRARDCRRGEKITKEPYVPHPWPLSSFCGHLSSSSFKLILMGNSIHILLTTSEEWVDISNQRPRTGLLSPNTEAQLLCGREQGKCLILIRPHSRSEWKLEGPTKGYWFSNCSMYQNHLEVMKQEGSCPIPKVSDLVGRDGAWELHF